MLFTTAYYSSSLSLPSESSWLSLSSSLPDSDPIFCSLPSIAPERRGTGAKTNGPCPSSVLLETIPPPPPPSSAGCKTSAVSNIRSTNDANFGCECFVRASANSLAEIVVLLAVVLLRWRICPLLLTLLLLHASSPSSSDAASIRSINCRSPPSCNSLRSQVD